MTTRKTAVKRTVVAPVKLEYLLSPQEFSFPLYRKQEGGFTLFLKSGEVLEPQKKESLSGEGVKELYVSIRHLNGLDSYFTRNARSVVRRGDLPLETKSRYLYDAATQILKNFFDGPEQTEKIGMARELAETTLELVLEEPQAFYSLLEVSSHDYYTFSHSVDVMLYAIGLGQRLRMKEERLKKLAAGAILHDIGKSRISREIVNKRGKLNEEEYGRMKEHVLIAGEMLMELGEEDPEILAAVVHHHEKYNGGGYPSGFAGSEIPLPAQIVGISDVFSALSTKRSYKDAFHSFEALKVMKEEMEGHFDPRVLKEFILMMGQAARR